jgi:hypothetical protein
VLCTEIFFTFLILLGTWLFLTRPVGRWLVVAGLIFGMAALTKPQVIFLPGFLVLLKLWRDRAAGDDRPWRRAIATGALLYAMVGAVLIPWAVRNTLTFDELVLISTNGGVTLLGGNNPSATGGHVMDDPLVEQRRFSVDDQVASDKRARALAIQWIKENPGRFIELIPLKALHLWAWDGEAEWFYQFDYEDDATAALILRAVRIANQILYVAIMLCFVAAFVALMRRRDATAYPWSLFPYIFVAYLTAISVVFSGQSRFHYPAMPWVIMMAAWFVVNWLESRTRAAEDA